jgi:hypothetical protein
VDGTPQPYQSGLTMQQCEGWHPSVAPIAPIICGITPRHTKIAQVRLLGGRGSGDRGRGTFEVGERKFLSVIGPRVVVCGEGTAPSRPPDLTRIAVARIPAGAAP